MSFAHIFSTKQPALTNIEGVRRALQKQRFGDKCFLATNQGIGIILDEDGFGYKFVRRIVPGSPAEDCGTIRVGDRVLEINGRDISRLNVKDCGVLVSECDKIVAMVLSRKLDAHNAMKRGDGGSSSSFSSSSPTSSPSGSSSSPSLSSSGLPSPLSALAADAIAEVLGESFTPPRKNSSSSSTITGLQQSRHRSDSEASDTATVTMDNEEERITSDGRVEFSVLLEKGKVIDDNEELVQRVLYSKGHLSFIRGKVLGNKINFESRWVALRHGRLIVTKGKSCKITKAIDLSRCTITNLLQSPSDTCPIEYWFGVKHPNRATMYFGDTSKENIVRLFLAVKGKMQCDDSVLDLKSSPANFCSARMPGANEYAQLLASGGHR